MKYIKSIWYNTKTFFWKIWNFWRFRKEIFNFMPWDSTYNMNLFLKSLEYTEKEIRDNDIAVSSQDTANDIKRFRYLIQRQLDETCYFEDVGGEYDKLKFDFIPVEGKPDLMEIVDSPEGYTKDEKEPLWEAAHLLQEVELKEATKLFKRFQEWWD